MQLSLRISIAMYLKPFKLDIDELINEFAEVTSTTLADMKRIWLSKKFSFIFEASPSSNLAFFMQSLYAHCLGYMVSGSSLSHRLGGLYCLHCLFETQPFKPPFKIYLSIGELKALKNLVVDSKRNGIKVVSALIKNMLEQNIFLFGFVDSNEISVAERVNELTEIQNARIQVAYKKLFANTRIEHFIDMNLGKELDVGMLKQMSTDYAEAKGLAIKEVSEMVDVQNIRHIAQDERLIGHVMEKTANGWNVQKELFYQQTGLNQHPATEPARQQDQEEGGNWGREDIERFGDEIEQLLSKDPQL